METQTVLMPPATNSEAAAAIASTSASSRPSMAESSWSFGLVKYGFCSRPAERAAPSASRYTFNPASRKARVQRPYVSEAAPRGRLPERTTISPAEVSAITSASAWSSTVSVISGPGSLMSVLVPPSVSTTLRLVRVSPGTEIAWTLMLFSLSVSAIHLPV